ncbi:MAG: preprotein translocase subunit YajC [Actinobacteria bacterium ADurb.Bin444]|nr:MAG: preprotein translocase subunit YajC [Actinobacteria bacterium ADurb.Bin444]
MNNIGLLAIYVVGFIAIFYFLAVRPQQKQRKAHEQLINSVKRGDRIVTIGGVFGTVKRVEEGLVVVEIDKGVNIKVARRAIAEIASAEQKATAAKVLDKPVKDEDVEEIEPVEAEAVEEVDADATEPPADVEEDNE